VTSLSPGLWHTAKRRPIQAHDPATTVPTWRVEPIHDRVDEHPFVPVVLEQDHSEAFAKHHELQPSADPSPAPPLVVRSFIVLPAVPAREQDAADLGRRDLVYGSTTANLSVIA
jgi:hypothetical protein